MDLEDVLQDAVMRGASDIHFCSGQSPWARAQGELFQLNGGAVQNGQSSCWLLQVLAPFMEKSLYARFLEGYEVDFSFATSRVGRFRVNVFKSQKGTGAVLRHILENIPNLTEINAPKVLPDLLKSAGLFLVTGPTGSGKSTTLAAVLHHLNQTTSQHLITLEDPIEFIHTSQKCLVTQREVGQHSKSFSNALRAALREDPDVILVGELRDSETIRLALTAAETGHLVLASLHTRSAAASIDRIVDVFEGAEKAMVRTQLSESLIGVVSQTLYRPIQGQKQCAAFEVMVATPAIRHLIREGKTSQIHNAIQTGAAYGMQTMAQAMQAAPA
ncbi:MAG: PilT/PilU family type 4a pilus ATPase [Burkholderiales bacterium]|nr:PilT/PilU family type 4a pilus ATPase [Burkholderiales bacterium]